MFGSVVCPTPFLSRALGKVKRFDREFDGFVIFDATAVDFELQVGFFLVQLTCPFGVRVGVERFERAKFQFILKLRRCSVAIPQNTVLYGRLGEIQIRRLSQQVTEPVTECCTFSSKHFEVAFNATSESQLVLGKLSLTSWAEAGPECSVFGIDHDEGATARILAGAVAADGQVFSARVIGKQVS